MSKTFSRVLTGVIVSFIIFVAYTLATNVYSDTRDARERGTTGRTIEPTPAPPATPSPKSTPPPSAGITSQTSGSVSTGGNTGGQVTTGDEHIGVFEINIGPTNSPPPPDEEEGVSPPTPTPTCESNGRARTNCPPADARTR